MFCAHQTLGTARGQRTHMVFARFGAALSIVAVSVIAGVHLPMLQCVAWSRMIVTYSLEQNSLIKGFERTFSGKAPCSMCKVVRAEQEKQSRANAEVWSSFRKLEGWTRTAPAGLFRPQNPVLFSLDSHQAFRAFNRPEPDVPVPRV